MSDLLTPLILLALLLALAGTLRLDLLPLALNNALNRLAADAALVHWDPGLKVSARSSAPRRAQMTASKPAFHRSGRRH